MDTGRVVALLEKVRLDLGHGPMNQRKAAQSNATSTQHARAKLKQMAAAMKKGRGSTTIVATRGNHRGAGR